uniref:Thioredoxin domain-containing protein n=1 Tax=Prymnesium polylepis TaxID=72548 RepID=A0A7S4HFD4_9EUKA|mmetsp:Transcript_49467/g.137107  ORF Transcript_49467/g.137107 Transcript_49467/m.137107 type:complete len:174 (-) Transcript_49467:393-914(-)
MKPAWDSLASEYADSNKVIVADVDCTAAGEPLCERFGIEGFPTIKYFNPPDEDGEVYEGGRDLGDLQEFAKTLGPGCSVASKENCTPEKLAELEAVLETPEASRVKELDELAAELKAAEEAHDALLKDLQAQYEASNEKVEAMKKEKAPRIKLLKSANAKPKAAAAAAPKDEV